MDFLFELLPLFFVVWVLLRALRRRPAPASHAEPAADPSEPRELTPFEELVRRIEAAAAEAERQKAGAAPPPLAVAAPRLPAAPRPSSRTSARPPEEFRSLEETARDRKAEFRSLEAPASEPEFHPIYDLTPEERALHESHRVVPGPAPSAHMPSSVPPSGRRAAPPPSDRARGLHALVAQLHTPEGARTAFLMREVMGERRGARRDLRD